MILNIVIPMAGHGSRFRDQGYATPKPLIKIHGKPMIQVVINNIKPSIPHRFIFLCLKEHIKNYQIDQQLKQYAPESEIILVDQVTEGAACTVLLAKDLINTSAPLMITNSDQWVNTSMDTYLQKTHVDSLDGLIMTMTAHDPKWSFVRLDQNKSITEVLEKQPVSDEATVGIYNYRKGSDFIWAAEQMIKKDFRVNNEFYVAPAYNELIAAGKKLDFFNIGNDAEVMYGLGTPDDLQHFLKLPVSHKAAR